MLRRTGGKNQQLFAPTRTGLLHGAVEHLLKLIWNSLSCSTPAMPKTCCKGMGHDPMWQIQLRHDARPSLLLRMLTNFNTFLAELHSQDDSVPQFLPDLARRRDSVSDWKRSTMARCLVYVLGDPSDGEPPFAPNLQVDLANGHTGHGVAGVLNEKLRGAKLFTKLSLSSIHSIFDTTKQPFPSISHAKIWFIQLKQPVLSELDGHQVPGHLKFGDDNR